MIGAMSVNEIRALEDMDPIEGGDVHMVPMNMTPLEDVGKEPQAAPRPTGLPPPPPPPEETEEDEMTATRRLN